MSNVLRASIEINASPEAVRAKFLDFSALPSYSRFFEKVDSPRPGIELQKGDKVSIKITNSPTFAGSIVTNTPELFAWTGSVPLIFTGTHTFHWTPSQTTPGGTTFMQEEKFTGLLGGLLYSDGAIAKSAGMKEKTRKGWEGFNVDLKRAVEAGQG
ncbi:uncharacterized protein M421DRAFT_643 [Didymella exigua CBS 183.55]|uniref:Uncharacterized protein n=1 Tax=Didymella exigua CBS 183.55 TaxID=1150837 RepID=A0A6A5S181_9PLEO|nr:uncharacterized protein M421DRAFT_643 [Didymella exigua CBS 183.55]KAF1933204.1 hypothetical protein M421DRAFT_643 [Didymella exigua CBS 183.55]